MPEGGLELRGSRLAAAVGSPLVMGILNVTPDSFSDGGEFLSRDAAAGRAMDMIAEGAAIIDVGPESTRPGSQPVEAAEQIRRAIPVLRDIRLRDERIVLSIDTRLAAVARAAIEAGADVVNDVSALRDDPELVRVIAESGMGVVLMHRRGTSADMQNDGGPQYDDVVGEIRDFLAERLDFAAEHGIELERTIVDPGIGFGKRREHNVTILRRLNEFTALGRPVLIGASRKRFIGDLANIDHPRRRDAASLACAMVAAQQGASIIRTHDVRGTTEALRLLKAIGGIAAGR
jgi:dihydropteroate synthase